MTFLHGTDPATRRWVHNQNQRCLPCCRNLYSAEQYQADLACADTLESCVRQCARDLIDGQKLTTGLALLCGTAERVASYFAGSTADEKGLAVDGDTVFDLASVTKLFLTFAYHMVWDRGAVDFSRPLGYYCGPQFPNIRDLPLERLLHFDGTLVTRKRLADCSPQEALSLLDSVELERDRPVYSDIPAMILGLVFEKIASLSFGDFVQKEIIDALSLTRTFWRRPACVDTNHMDYDGEYRFHDGAMHQLHTRPYEPNDPKARLFGNQMLCGHAGLFSSAQDMARISRALLRGELLSPAALQSIADAAFMGSENSHFGRLCYTKNPVREENEVFWGMAGNAFAIAGYTGTYWMIDPLNQCFCFLGGNKLHHRLTRTDDPSILDGLSVPYTGNYVYQRDTLRETLSRKALLFTL